MKIDLTEALAMAHRRFKTFPGTEDKKLDKAVESVVPYILAQVQDTIEREIERIDRIRDPLPYHDGVYAGMQKILSIITEET